MDSRRPSIQKQLSHIEQLIKALDSSGNSPASIQALELVQTLLEIHGTGLEQALEIIHDSPGGQELIDRLPENPVIPNLLVHNLHPLDLETRVCRALDLVKPRLGQHGGDVVRGKSSGDRGSRRGASRLCHDEDSCGWYTGGRYALR